MAEGDQELQVRASIEHIADRAASKAVRDTLLLIGIDLADPIKAQEEFAALRSIATPKMQSDLAFLRRLHGAADTVSDAGWRTLVKLLLTALLAGIGIVTKDYWLSHIWK